MKRVIFFLFFPFMIYSQTRSDSTEIIELFNSQIECWNEGNIDCYMEGYWKSDSLQFIGSKGIQYGWQKTLENYKRSYPSKSEMGILKFDILHLEFLSNESCFVIGKWTIEREKGNISGHFTLLLKKFDEGWRIVIDHSS